MSLNFLFNIRIKPPTYKQQVLQLVRNMNIDPQIFFQRLIAIKDHHECPAELFQYEPCSHPQTLFNRYGLPREANKPQTAEAVGGGGGGGGK